LEGVIFAGAYISQVRRTFYPLRSLSSPRTSIQLRSLSREFLGEHRERPEERSKWLAMVFSMQRSEYFMSGNCAEIREGRVLYAGVCGDGRGARPQSVVVF
jgi:hypothetical protein